MAFSLRRFTPWLFGLSLFLVAAIIGLLLSQTVELASVKRDKASSSADANSVVESSVAFQKVILHIQRERGLTHLSMFWMPPALSFVPEARPPPKGC